MRPLRSDNDGVLPMISLVVAMDRNGLIGVGNRVPWRLPDDMKYFRQITMGKPVVMGRKTYESIPDRFRPLAGRTNIILTKQLGYNAAGCIVTHSLSSALEAAHDAQEVMVIGGAEIYGQFLPTADRIYLTMIDGEFEGDVYFPELDREGWYESYSDEHSIDERHAYPFTFLLLERRLESESIDEADG